MIELCTELLDESIKFNINKVNVLEINNKELFNKVVYALNKNINTNEYFGEMYLYEKNEEIDLNRNCMIIHDFYNIFSNQTKILKGFYDDIEKEYKFNYEDETIISLQKPLIKSVRDILIEYDYELTQKETIEIKDLLKIMDVRFDVNYYDKPLENVFLLIDLIANFKICKVLIFVNAKCFFTQEELVEIYKMIVYKRINVLFVEYYKGESNKAYENKVLIDEDFDEFYIN
ncbi:type II-A CRISPR-associated protein Csn2 [Clostridium weizhouense]|uniref:Type II-A CRISPR-associated protein Csn2 n=1 Tax=Clostridium weizhouense TaxID=2859781 RepID=A0ABS7APN8_9CLOT|nr:type II-A CRISPR-associated protein Csn2 [Clostridium weizhouense]MBW6409666.1 type II-A CRISPR-associated protein Csn2 [Clostridium weizhouense]